MKPCHSGHRSPLPFIVDSPFVLAMPAPELDVISEIFEQLNLFCAAHSARGYFRCCIFPSVYTAIYPVRKFTHAASPNLAFHSSANLASSDHFTFFSAPNAWISSRSSPNSFTRILLVDWPITTNPLPARLGTTSCCFNAAVKMHFQLSASSHRPCHSTWRETSPRQAQSLRFWSMLRLRS